MPKRCSMRVAKKFLADHNEWVETQLEAVPQPKKLVSGSEVSVGGKPFKINHSGSLRGVAHIEGDQLVVSGPVEHSHKKVVDFLKKRAKEKVQAYASTYAEQLGVCFHKIRIGDPSSRWGSCSSQGTISVSWRLVMAPEEVLAYVVAHEIAHLREMNHSAAFWELVEVVFPDYKKAKGWLREHGRGLHKVV